MIGGAIVNLAKKAYIAGIMDGEGTVTLIRQHSNENYSPEVSVANTSIKLLQWLKSNVGGGTIVRKKMRSERHKQAYTWKLRDNKALQLLREINRYLILRKPHAELILKKYKKLTPRNGRYTPWQLKRKAFLVEQIKGLNAR